MSTRLDVHFDADLIEVRCTACGEVLSGREDSPVPLDELLSETEGHACPEADYDDQERV